MVKLTPSLTVQRPIGEPELHEARDTGSAKADAESMAVDDLNVALTGRSIKELWDFMQDYPDVQLEVLCDESVLKNCGITGQSYTPLQHAGRRYVLKALAEDVLLLQIDAHHTVVVDTDNASHFRLDQGSLAIYKERKSAKGKHCTQEPGSLRREMAAALRLQLCDTKEPEYAALKGNVDLSEYPNRMALAAFMSVHPDIPLFAVVKNSEFYDDANLIHLKGSPSSTQYELEMEGGSIFMRIPHGVHLPEDRRIDVHMFGRCLCLSEDSIARMHRVIADEAASAKEKSELAFETGMY